MLLVGMFVLHQRCSRQCGTTVLRKRHITVGSFVADWMILSSTRYDLIELKSFVTVP